MSKRKLDDQSEKSSGSSPSRNYCVVIHSGKHKPFAELLCRDLQARGCPAYIDQDSDYLIKSDGTVRDTVEVAAAARLAILLLSEEFFSATKWPMMELSTIVQKYIQQLDHMRNVKLILPVYFRMSIKNLVCTYSYKYDRQNYRPIWYLTHWEKWARADRRVHLQAWEAAWNMIKKHEGVHMCIPCGSCDWTRDSQKIIDDEQGRRMIVQKVFADPKLGFAIGFTSIPRFANLHATYPAPQHVQAMPGGPQLVPPMPRARQQVRTMPAAAQAQHEERHGKSTPRSAWSHAPWPPAPSAIPARPGVRMSLLYEAAALQLQLSASVIPPPPVPSVPALPPTPRPVIPEWLLNKPLFKGECSKTFECGGSGNDDDQGRDSRDEEDSPDDDEEDEEQNGHDSDEHDDSGESQEESEYVPPADIEEVDDDDDDDKDDDDEPCASGDDDDDEDYDEDSGSDDHHSG